MIESVYIESSRCNSAHVVIVSGHQNVAVQSPIFPPAVFNQPVVLAFQCSVADKKYRVVGANFLTSSVKENTIACWVVHKLCSCIDTYANWPIC